MNVSAAANQELVRLRYTFTRSTVEGLPKRGLFKSDGKYFLRISIDGKDEWKTQELRTKESTIVWQGEENRHEFESVSTALLSATLCKTHSNRPTEELGTVSQLVGRWLDVPNAFASQPISSNKPAIRVSLLISEMREPTVDMTPEERVLQVVEAAEDKVSGMRTLRGVNAVVTTSKTLGHDQSAVKEYVDPWEPFLQKLDAFNTLMDAVSEVHPYAKMAWTVISAAYKVVKAQQARDEKIQDLVEKMKRVYELLLLAKDLQTEKAHESVLSRLSIQTIDCGHYITTCTKNPHFLHRLVDQAVSNINHKVDMYMSSFDDLLSEFRDGSQVRIEINAIRILEDVKNLVMEESLRDIPYVGGAGYEYSKQCLANTRIALLDEVCTWAASDSDDTPNVCLLMGPAGTGKSTIAHTIAHRFDKMQRLGASFCFSRNEGTTRRPESLFRNMAHDLANFHPAFRAALGQVVGGHKARSTTNDLQVQLDRFIREPADRLTFSGTTLVMVDALDESAEVQERELLVRIISRDVNKLSGKFRFFLTARSESDIIHYLDQRKGIRVIQMPSLIEDVRLTADIQAYIQHELMDDDGRLPRGLPENACSTLASKAEGLFQWASVACRLIKDRRAGQSAPKQYKLLIGDTASGPGSLDSLYTTILKQVLADTPSARASFKVIIGFVLTAVEPLSMRSLATFMDLLEPDGDLDVQEYLPYLGSLLSGVGDATTPVRPLHSSFADVLRSPARGGIYYIGASDHHERLAKACLKLLQRDLHFNMGGLESSYHLNREVAGGLQSRISEDISYACRYWGYHLSKCPPAFADEVADSVRYLLINNFLFWLDALSIIEAVNQAERCLSLAIAGLQRLPDAITIAEDGIRFIRAFGLPISDSAAHVYISALVWTPVESKIGQNHVKHYPRTARIAAGPLVAWPNDDILIYEHSDAVRSVLYSPDGARIVSCSEDRTIRIWDAKTGQAIGAPLTGHAAGVLSIAMSSDGSRIFSGSYDKTIRIWDAKTGRTIGSPLVGHDALVHSVAASPDGTQIVSGSFDHTIRTWDATTGKTIAAPLARLNDQVNSVTFSPDGTQIVSGSRDGTVAIWDAKTGRRVGAPLVGHDSSVLSVAFSPDGDKIASGSRDKTIRIWNAKTGQGIGMPLAGHEDVILTVAFSLDGDRIISGSEDRTIRMWDTSTGHAIGAPLTGHEGAVRSVVFSHDGTQLVSGCADLTIRIWDAKREHAAIGTPLAGQDDNISSATLSPQGMQSVPGTGITSGTSGKSDMRIGHTRGGPFTGHEDGVRSVIFSPDGARIVSGSEDRTIRIWDVKTGRAIGEPLTGHGGGVLSMALSPDGSRIVSGCYDKSIHIWDARTCQAICPPLFGHDDLVHSIAVSTDGSQIVSGSFDNTIRTWDTTTGQAIGAPLVTLHDQVLSVAFSPDGMQIVSGTRDGTVAIWDAKTGQVIGGPLVGHDEYVFSVAFSPDGTRIASGSRDKTIRIWDAKTGEAMGAPLTGHEMMVRWVAFSPDGTQIVSSSHDKTIRLWNVRTGQAIGIPLVGHEDIVWSVAFSSDGTRLVSGCADNTIRVWDATTGRALGAPLAGHHGAVKSAVISSDGARIVSGSADSTLQIWDAEIGQALGAPLSGHEAAVLSVAISPDGIHIVSGSADRTVRLWDARTAKPIGTALLGHRDLVHSVSFSPDGTQIVSGSGDNTIRIWDTETGQAIGAPMGGHQHVVYSVAFSPDGAHIVSGSGDNSVRIWDVKTAQPIGEPLIGHDDSVNCVAFSPNGTQVVSAARDRTIRIWDAKTGQPLGAPLSGHDEEVCSVAFSPDGKELVSGSRDMTIRIWDAKTGQAVESPLAGHNGPVYSVTFSPDGTHIVSASDDKLIRVWNRNGTSRRSLSLSPDPTHQPTQPYEGDVDLRTGWRTGWSTGSGWITGNGREHILWVPHHLRRRIYMGPFQPVNQTSAILLDLSQFVHGTGWQECLNPLK